MKRTRKTPQYTVTVITTGPPIPRRPGPAPRVQYANTKAMEAALSDATAGYTPGPRMFGSRSCRTWLGAHWYAFRRGAFRRSITAKVTRYEPFRPSFGLPMFDAFRTAFGVFEDGEPYRMFTLVDGTPEWGKSNEIPYPGTGWAYSSDRDEPFQVRDDRAMIEDARRAALGRQFPGADAGEPPLYLTVEEIQQVTDRLRPPTTGPADESRED